MKNCLIIFLFTALTACNFGSKNKEPESFTIEGQLKGVSDQKIYLKLKPVEGIEVQEFAPVEIVNGLFQFKGKLINPPAIVSFSFEDPEVKLWKSFVINNSNMSLSILQKENGGRYLESKLKGSASQDQYDKYMDDLGEINKESRLFTSIYRKLGNNGKLPRDQWSDEDLAQIAKMEKLSKEVKINKNKYLLSAVYGNNDLMKLLAIPELSHWGISPFNSPKLCDIAFDKLNAALKTSHIRQYYSSEIFRKSEQARLALEVTVGNTYKDFTQNDQNETPVTASNLIKSNKYVLLDFWASWCGPCRKENPNLLRAYNKYHNKGFEVLAISNDHDKEAWLKAIKKDGMPWTQISDLKGANNMVAKLYSVTAIPSNFLINSEGTIVAINLRGEALHKKLEELLSK